VISRFRQPCIPLNFVHRFAVGLHLPGDFEVSFSLPFHKRRINHIFQIPVIFQALFVTLPLFRGEFGDFRHREQFLKHNGRKMILFYKNSLTLHNQWL
jgi:hypothetical protein